MKYKLLKGRLLAWTLLAFATQWGYGQAIDSTLLRKAWAAQWIAVPDSDPTGYGVYYFRKAFSLASRPAAFPVHVSADNKYKLYVNEQLVSIGPARGDILHWNFATVDLAPFLRAGNNVVAAQVWNEGVHRPLANVSNRTAFILQGGVEDAGMLNTNESWKAIQDKSYSPIPVVMRTFYVAGPGEYVDLRQSVGEWKALSLDDSEWPSAKTLAAGAPKYKIGAYGEPGDWLLVPSPLPAMELTDQRLATVRRARGVNIPAGFPAQKASITFPANTESSLILDQGFLTNAYLTLNFSKGKNSSLTLDYVESLFTTYPQKGNRNEIEGKIFLGRKDSILANGLDNQSFTTLAFRTYRYIQLKVTTQDEALVLEDIHGTFTGYPFERLAKLTTDHPDLPAIFDIGWRTARLCAYDTYVDCPYYEQLQYVGDARIQALVSLYNSGDDRLVKNFLTQIDYSRESEGLTMSRYPSSIRQYIAPFSLWYIGALHDYMMYGKDLDFVKGKLVGVRHILDYFAKFQQADGRLLHLPGWNFTDWVEVKDWTSGIRQTGQDGHSALLDLQLLSAHQAAAHLEATLGMQEHARLYTDKADRLKRAIQDQYWDAGRRLYADNAEKSLFSQHANTLAILTGLVPEEKLADIGRQLLADTTLAPASIYFKYYLHQALTKAGYGDDYLDWLGKWKENIAMGLTTWAEISNINAARSDCHAWGSSPNIEFFRILLGIDSDAPGFAKVKIEPHLGDIKTIGGEMPHPNGMIKVAYTIKNDRLNAVITLPPDTTGVFVWKGKRYDLKAGENVIKI